MNLIVSKTLEDKYTNFTVVDSLKKVMEINGVTALVIHSYEDTDFDAGVLVSKLREAGLDKFIYINSTPSTTMRTLMSGVRGKYFEDEFYFEDEEELTALVEDSFDEDTDSDESYSLAAPALGVVSDFIESFARGEERIKTPLYLERVKGAVNELCVITKQQELQINSMGASALDVFEKASKIIKNMDTQKKLIEMQLENLEQNVSKNVDSPRFENGIIHFPPYNFMGNAKVCLFREYTPTRFLTSFVLAYEHYLHYTKNKRVKVVFVHQKGHGIHAKYNEFIEINDSNKNMASLYDAEIIATNTPKKEIMKEILMKPVDIVIVVDRLYGRMDIVSGRVRRVNVASSRSDIKRYNLNPEETIFSVTTQPKQLFCLSVVKSFPTQIDARYAIYYQVFEEAFHKLDDVFGIS